MYNLLGEFLSKRREINTPDITYAAHLYPFIKALYLIFKEVRNNLLSRLDLLINNAGISHIGLLQDMTDEEWHRVIDTNLTAVFHTCRLAIPLMLRSGTGRILNISSVWGNTGASTEVAYSASKGGLNAFTKALAKELAPSNISVNAIACGYINTAMNAHLTEEEKKDLFSEIPSGRPGTPPEVADLAALIAQAPLYMTGQIITMDGAWT